MNRLDHQGYFIVDKTIYTIYYKDKGIIQSMKHWDYPTLQDYILTQIPYNVQIVFYPILKYDYTYLELPLFNTFMNQGTVDIYYYRYPKVTIPTGSSWLNRVYNYIGYITTPIQNLISDLLYTYIRPYQYVNRVLVHTRPAYPLQINQHKSISRLIPYKDIPTQPRLLPYRDIPEQILENKDTTSIQSSDVEYICMITNRDTSRLPHVRCTLVYAINRFGQSVDVPKEYIDSI